MSWLTSRRRNASMFAGRSRPSAISRDLLVTYRRVNLDDVIETHLDDSGLVFSDQARADILEKFEDALSRVGAGGLTSEDILSALVDEPLGNTAEADERSRIEPPAAGTAMHLASALMPGVHGEDWLDEALDHLACVAEDRGNVRRARRGLLLAVVVSLPVAWYGELRRRVLRRA